MRTNLSIAAKIVPLNFPLESYSPGNYFPWTEREKKSTIQKL
jgi:hypothetical protein